MEKISERLNKMRFVSHDEQKDRVYGLKGSEAREQYENNLKETKFGTIRRYVEALNVSKMSLKFEFANGNS